MSSLGPGNRAFSIVTLFLVASIGLADVITVDDDGPADFATIQAAIDAASDGDEIVVAPGTYTGSGDQVVDTRGKAIVLRALFGGEDPSTIDGGGVRHGIVCRSGEGNDTVIEGFVITNCYPAGYDWSGNGQIEFWEFFGGGTWCRDGSSPTIRECFFLSNRAEYGGAICNGDENGVASNPIITDCAFLQNQSAPVTGGVGGAIYNTGSSPVIADSLFDGNRAYSGGAILNWSGSNPEILGCDFFRNTARNGGAIYNETSQPQHVGCVFELNVASSGGGAVFNAEPSSNLNRPLFENCEFRANSCASDGGAMQNFSVSPEILDCVFERNQASIGGAIMSWNTSQPELGGSVICENAAPQLDGPYDDLGGNTVSDSCPGACLGDLDGSGIVDGADLNQLLGEWGQSGSDADFDGSGLVDGEDLLVILSAWGECP